MIYSKKKGHAIIVHDTEDLLKQTFSHIKKIYKKNCTLIREEHLSATAHPILLLYIIFIIK